MLDLSSNRLVGGICRECNWKQSLSYFRPRGGAISYSCIRCGCIDVDAANYSISTEEIIFDEPIYDRDTNLNYIQVIGSKYLVVFSTPNEVGRITESSAIANASLIYLVSGTSYDIVVVDSADNAEFLGQALLRFHTKLSSIFEGNLTLKQKLNRSKKVRGIRGLLHDNIDAVLSRTS